MRPKADDKPAPEKKPASSSLVESAIARRRAEAAEDVERRAREQKARLEMEELERKLRNEQNEQSLAESQRESALRPEPTRSLAAASEARSQATGEAPPTTGRVDWALLATALAGYSDNIQQTVDVLGSTDFVRRPAAFVGADLMSIVQASTARTQHDFRLQLRGQHYISTKGDYDFDDDGTFNALYAGRYELSATTTASFLVANTLSTLSSARLSDGIIFRFDPDNAQRTFDLTTVRAGVTHRLAQNLRYEQGINAGASFAISSAPTPLPNGGSFLYRGVEFLQLGTESLLSYDFDARNVGLARLRYFYVINRGFPDLNVTPPPDPGFIDSHAGEAALGLTHLFTERLSSRTFGGATVASPFFDVAGAPLTVAPYFEQSLTYTAPTFYTTVGVNYNFGVIGPRVGAGTAGSVFGNLTAEPFSRGPLRPLQLLVNAAGTLSRVQGTPNGTSDLRFVLAGAEARYGLTRWLAVVAGYNFRWSEFITPPAQATPFVRNLAFVGLTVMASSTRDIPPFTNFTPPVPGG